MTSSPKPQGWQRIVRNLKRIPNDLTKPYRKWRRKQSIYGTPRLPKALNKQGTVLFLAPEAGLGPHQANMGFLARTMQQLGHNVLMARCFDLFARCPVMGAHQLGFDASPDERRRACLSCINVSIDFSSHYGVATLDLRSLNTERAEAICKEQLANAPRDLSEFSYDGVAFGKLSTVDLVLATKRHRLHDVDDATRSKWLKLISSSLKMYLLVDELCERFPISTIVHHNDYSLLLGGRLAAEKHGVHVQGITLAYHKNIDQGRVVIYPTYWPIYNKQVADRWEEWRDVPLRSEQVHEVVTDLVVRTSGAGSHIYSAARGKSESLYQTLNLDPAKKLIVAYTSSLDEFVAGKMLMQAVAFDANDPTQPFADQIDWLQQLVSHVKDRDDLQLVVRVHPREGANHRESQVSEHLPMLEAAFGSLPSNCQFIWPSDRTSSYDLGEAADLVLTSWSTIGIEMARLGVPVLSSFRIAEAPYPNDDFLIWEPNSELYFHRLEQLLTEPPSFQRWVHAIRWYQYANLAVSLDVSDATGPIVAGRPQAFQMSQRATQIERALLGRSIVPDINWQDQFDAAEIKQPSKESAALVTQLQRLIHYLSTGEDALPTVAVNSVPLEFDESRFRTPSNPDPSERSADWMLEINERQVRYRPVESKLGTHGPESTASFAQPWFQSPMIARLGKMLIAARRIEQESTARRVA